MGGHLWARSQVLVAAEKDSRTLAQGTRRSNRGEPRPTGRGQIELNFRRKKSVSLFGFSLFAS